MNFVHLPIVVGGFLILFPYGYNDFVVIINREIKTNKFKSKMSQKTYNSLSPIKIEKTDKLVSIAFPSTASGIKSLATENLETIDITGCNDTFKALVHASYDAIPSITIIDNDKSKYETVGSIYYSDGSTTLPSEDVDSSKTPIGILVIPSSHMSDGKARIMSLAEMTEDGVGSLTNRNGLVWGDYGTDTSLHNYNQIPCVGHDDDGNWTPDNTIDHTNDYGYICSDRTDWTTLPNPLDPGTNWKYNDEDCHIPSPFNADGTFNSAYSATSYSGGTINNALSDFNGKSNTATLVALGADYKPATACSLYSTEGTNSGDWYLPAIGELAYIMPRFTVIQNSLTKLGNKALALVDNYYYWSSTEYDSDNAYRLHTTNGSVGYYNYQDGDYYVRAFLQV